jgi:hypothetical protein
VRLFRRRRRARARAPRRLAALLCNLHNIRPIPRNRITNFLASVTRILSSRARCRRRFHETRRDRVALPRGTGTPPRRRRYPWWWWDIRPKTPAGLGGAKREGRAQVIAIHLPPGTYHGPKLTRRRRNRSPFRSAGGETVTQAKGQS